MDKKTFCSSRILTWLVGGLLVLVVLLLVFKAGIMVGIRQSGFAARWSDNYHRNFGGPRQGFGPDFGPGLGDREFMNANGTFGEIIKINDQLSATSTASSSSLIIKGVGELEKVIVINSQTSIKRFREEIKLADLKLGDVVVVVGDPTDTGEIIAKLIRLMPPKPEKLNFRR